jgi:hypothetical protein
VNRVNGSEHPKTIQFAGSRSEGYGPYNKTPNKGSVSTNARGSDGLNVNNMIRWPDKRIYWSACLKLDND